MAYNTLSAQLDIVASLSIWFTSTIAAGVVLIGNRHSKVNILFTLVAVNVALFGLARALCLAAQNAEASLFWLRGLMAPAILIPITYLHFVSTFLGIIEKQKKIIRGLYVFFFIYFVLNFTPFFIRTMETTQYYRFRPIPGITFHFFLVVWVLCIVYALFLLVQAYRSTQGVQKQQIKYILLGWVIGFIGGTSDYLLFYNIPWLPFGIGNWAILAYVLSIFYAIAKYNLFNIKVIATEFLIFVTWILAAVRLFFTYNTNDFLINGIFLCIIVGLGILIIRSTLNEVRQKEQLADLNSHLAQRVKEQTQEIKKAYEVEKTAHLELKTLDKIKNEFLLTTQHHLRTPLTIVKGYLQAFTTKKVGRLNNQGVQYVGKISQGVERMNNLVEELLDITQLQIKEELLSKDFVSLKDLVTEIIEDLKLGIAAKHLRVAVSLSDESLVKANKEKIKAALHSVIENAVMYNREQGSITITGAPAIHPIEKNIRVFRITVADTGIGIPKEEIPRLFSQYFQRGEEAMQIYATGRGLALAVACNIIKAHNGRIWAESEGKNKGTTFIIELPT